jgi:hypothetical protein
MNYQMVFDYYSLDTMRQNGVKEETDGANIPPPT